MIGVRTCSTCRYAAETHKDVALWRCLRASVVSFNPMDGKRTLVYKFPYYCETSRRFGEDDSWLSKWLFRLDGCCMPEGRHWEPADGERREG